MKKILKVKVKRTSNPGGGTHYDFPEVWDKEKISVLAMESATPEEGQKVLDRGNKDEYFLAVVKRVEDETQFLASPDISELTRDEAIALGSVYRPQRIKTLDQDKVNQIFAKSAIKEELTQQDIDALNPDHPEKGLNKGQSFTELLDEHLNK